MLTHAAGATVTTTASPPLDHLAVMRRWRDWRQGRRPPSPPPSPSPLERASRLPPPLPSPPAPLLLLAPMEGLADRPMRVALANLQRRACARIVPGDPRTDSPAAVAAVHAILLLRRSYNSGSGGDSALFASPGFDEACQEFIRVPAALSPGGRVPTVARGVCRAFCRAELGATPLAAQLMGSDPVLMAAAARQLASAPSARPPRRRRRGDDGQELVGGDARDYDDGSVFGGKAAGHVSLNCGCPANTVTGNGAGSSLLRDPRALEALVASIRGALPGSGSGSRGNHDGGPPPLLSVKVRAGFDDASLFGDNALAARDGGAGALVVHPRTKRQGYRGRADWALVYRAQRLLEEGEGGGGGTGAAGGGGCGGGGGVPVVGNGDVVLASDALALALATGCSGVMVGRGAVQDPLIFLRVRAAFGALVHLRDESGGGGGGGGGLSAAGERDELLLRAGNGGDGDGARASRLVVEASAAAAQGLRFEGGAGGEAALIESFLRDYVALADAETRLKRGGGRGSAARAGGGEGGDPGPRPDDDPGGGGGGEDEGDERGRLGRLKSVLKYLFTGQPRLRDALAPVLRVPPERGASGRVLELACAAVREHWRAGGPDAATPSVDHFS